MEFYAPRALFGSIKCLLAVFVTASTEVAPRGKPGLAAEMLHSDENKYISAMMPCAVGVYQKQDGEIYVSSMNMKLMSKVFNGKPAEILSKVAADDERILEFLKD